MGILDMDYTAKPKKVKDLDLKCIIDGEKRRFHPKEDLTPIESMQITLFLISQQNGEIYDSSFFIKENNLERHFE